MNLDKLHNNIYNLLRRLQVTRRIFNDISEKNKINNKRIGMLKTDNLLSEYPFTGY